MSLLAMILKPAQASGNLLLPFQIFSRCAKMSRGKFKFLEGQISDGRCGMDRRRAEAFEVLGIPADSDADAVVHAYRRLARMTHPDVSADPEAGDRFASLAAAYRLASEAAAVVGGSASIARSGLRRQASEHGSEHVDGGPTSDGDRGWGSISSWSISLGPTPWHRQRQGAPIVAGPVFVSPARRTGHGEVRGG